MEKRVKWKIICVAPTTGSPPTDRHTYTVIQRPAIFNTYNRLLPAGRTNGHRPCKEPGSSNLHEFLELRRTDSERHLESFIVRIKISDEIELRGGQARAVARSSAALGKELDEGIGIEVFVRIGEAQGGQMWDDVGSSLKTLAKRAMCRDTSAITR
ncbi:hypothetical protein B0H19DRAFT_1254028 [Mycena capillaripes]|nr:hypothetical protein B0H19DRAFT_1254028 [Mycena capillaripes]